MRIVAKRSLCDTYNKIYLKCFNPEVNQFWYMSFHMWWENINAVGSVTFLGHGSDILFTRDDVFWGTDCACPRCTKILTGLSKLLYPTLG